MVGRPALRGAAPSAGWLSASLQCIDIRIELSIHDHRAVAAGSAIALIWISMRRNASSGKVLSPSLAFSFARIVGEVARCLRVVAGMSTCHAPVAPSSAACSSLSTSRHNTE